MGLPIANGPNLSNRTVSGQAASSRFIPEIWSTKLVTKFYDTTVFGEIANTDYEGEITNYGDKVYIRTRPDITVGDYEKGKDLEYGTPESPNVELLIDKGKYFTFTVDDVDAHQSDLRLIDEWSDDASEQMKIAIDTDMLGSIYADAAAENQGTSAGRISGAYNLGEAGAPVDLTKENIVDYIVDLGTVLDEQNIPETGRFLVLPPWACGLIKKSDLKDASLAGDSTSIVRNGRLGIIDRFMIYKSNLLAYSMEGTERAYHMIAGHKVATTFASQMTNMETLRNPKRFGDLVRGLQVYGYEVIKPDALVHLYAKKGAAA